MPDLIITPNRNTTTNPSIRFVGLSAGLSALNPSASSITLQVLPEGQVAFIGSAGSLFSITDALTGVVMSVGDITGLPILEVNSNDSVVMGTYGTNALVVSGTKIGIGVSSPNEALTVVGNISATGTIYASGGAGTSGYSGYSGRSGYSGYSGIGTSGYSGYSGYSGISGYSGYSGISGFSGYSGYSGISGFSGYSGYSGISGFSGYSGYSGISGFSGYSGYSGIGTSGFSGFSGFSGAAGGGGGVSGPNVSAISLGSVTGTTNINYSTANYFSATATGNVTWTISNSPSAGYAGGFILELTNGGSYTMIWPTTTRWPGGVASTLTTSGTDIIVFSTNDNGADWRALLSMADSK